MSQATDGTPEVATNVSLSDGGSGNGGGEGESPRILASDEDIADALGEAESAEDDENDPENEGESEAGEQESAPEEPKAETPVDAPATWTAQEKELFGKLPPELQRAVSRRESEREQFVNAKAQETAAARQERDQISQWTLSQLGPAVKAAQLAIEYEFAGIDWINLQKSDPAQFLQLDAVRRERMAGVQKALDSYNQFMQQQQAIQQQQHQTHVKEHLNREFTQALPTVRELVGQGFEHKAFAGELAGYLKSAGAPEDHIHGMDFGYQLILATKAMLYDKMQKSAKSAAQKVAQAPKLQGVKARNMHGNKGSDPIAAKRIIKEGGSSTENIAEALKTFGI